MARKRKVRLPNGREIEATVLPFRTSIENFNEYLLDDQTIIKLKVVVTEVLRLDGEYDQQGSPVYIVNNANVTSVDAPDELRRLEP